jgi:adenosylcobinamide amidohydrolase
MIPPNGGFRVLSNGSYNGGFFDSPQALINLGSMGGETEREMMWGSREENLRCTRETFRLMGYDPDRVVAEQTAANMNNASIGTVDADGIKVSVAITAGIRGNGGCAGDPAGFDEAERYYSGHGTIVMLFSVEAEMSDIAMLQLMNLVTQAKSEIIEEMQAKSLYSPRIATGSGTDQIAVMVPKSHAKRIDVVDSGSKFAIAVIGMVRKHLSEAFDWQSYMTPSEQCDAMVQLSRFGITGAEMCEDIRFPNRMKDLMDALPLVYHDPYVVAVFTAVLHIQDKINAGLIDGQAGLDVGRKMAVSALEHILPSSDLFTLRIAECRSLPVLLRLLLAMLIQYRATVLSEERT